MKRLLLLALAAAFAACSPSVPVGADNSTKFVVAEFDVMSQARRLSDVYERVISGG